MRIQLDMSEEQVKRLEFLMRETQLSTKKDLFNYALTLFEWAVDERKSGRLVAAVDSKENRYREIVIPPLEAAARKDIEATTSVLMPHSVAR